MRHYEVEIEEAGPEHRPYGWLVTTKDQSRDGALIFVPCMSFMDVPHIIERSLLTLARRVA